MLVKCLSKVYQIRDCESIHLGANEGPWNGRGLIDRLAENHQDLMRCEFWCQRNLGVRFKAAIAFLIHSFLHCLCLSSCQYLFRIPCLKAGWRRNLQAGAMTSAASSPSFGFTLKGENTTLRSYLRRCKRCATREIPIQHPTNWQVWCGDVWGWGKDASTLLYAWSPTSSEPSMFSLHKRILANCNKMITQHANIVQCAIMCDNMRM